MLQVVILEFMEWLAVSEVPFAILFTKADKLKANEKDKNFKQYRKRLEQDWEELPDMIITSASDKSGRDDLLKFIEETSKVFRQ